MTRKTWRNIFIGIIFLTIPCYLFAIGLYFIQDADSVNSTQSPDNSGNIVRTPINVTHLALTDPSLITTDIVFTSTPLGGGFTQIAPTSDGGFFTPVAPTSDGGFFTPVLFTPVIVNTATTIPTRFITATPQPATDIPTITPFPTNTPVPANTAIPTATTQILLPPTDTPSP